MRTKAGRLSGIIVMMALGLAFTGAPLAQTTSTTDVRNFEVISVDGNQLIVRDEKGAQEITVPDDFRFTVDGKKMAVSELKAGMKGTAAVTTTTTVKPVFVTEVREGEVLRASPVSMTVRTADGARKFTQAELDTKGIRIYKDGNSVRLSDLKKGDKLSATVITHGAPIVLTEKEVQAVLDEPAAAAPAPAPAPAAAPTQMAAATSTPTAPAAAPTTPTPAAPTPPKAAPPAEQSGLGLMWWVVIALIIALVVFFARRRKQP